MTPSQSSTRPDDTLMTQALADAVGATKRQVQFWTKHYILDYLPGTGRGRGQKRLYPRSELPIAAMARYLAASGVRVDTIHFAAQVVRHELTDSSVRGERTAWCRKALRGEVESYIVIPYHPVDGRYVEGINWSNRDNLIKMLPHRHGAIIVNVQKVMSPHAA